MRTATVADLRNNFRRIEAWLANGEDVRILKRGKGVARLIADHEPQKRFIRPNYREQIREIWGDLPPLTAEQTKEMRDWEDNE